MAYCRSGPGKRTRTYSQFVNYVDETSSSYEKYTLYDVRTYAIDDVFKLPNLVHLHKL